MRVPPYSEEQRAEALRLYVDEGPDIAATETGISVRTIYRWASAEGVSTTATSERTQAATSAAKERAAMNRAELRALLWEQAVKALHSMDAAMTLVVKGGKDQPDKTLTVSAPASEKKDLALTAAVLIDKARLEGGEATGRMETVSLTDGLDADTKRRLRERLARAVRGESGTDGAGGLSVGAGEPVDTPAASGVTD